MKNKKIALCGMFVGLALILSYLEVLIPVNVAVPGIKIGLANIITIIALYKIGIKEGVIIGIIRVILSGFMFSGLSTIIYGLAGTILSITIMVIIKNIKATSVISVSAIGAVCHNLGQIVVAFIVVDNINIFYYMPVLIISGVVSGVIIGIISGILIKNIQYIDFSN